MRDKEIHNVDESPLLLYIMTRKKMIWYILQQKYKTI